MNNLRETGNNQPFTVNFIDLDNDNASLAHLEELNVDDLNVDRIIETLQQKGYRLVNNDFDANATSEHNFLITFKHTYQTIDADHPNDDFPASELRKTGIQTVHYQGAGARTPIDNQSKVEINRSLVFDLVEKKIIKDNGWTKPSFRMIGTPDIPGYVPSESYVGGDQATIDQPDRKYVVTYHVNDLPSQTTQKAIVEFVDVDAQNKEISTSGTLTGAPYTKINYSPIGVINYLKHQGYELIDNGFSPNGEVQFFDNSDEYKQIYIVTMGHKKAYVNAENPLTGVESSSYEHDRIATVHYVGAGLNTPDDNSQIIKMNRTLTVDCVTKEILDKTDWQPSKQKFEQVTTPILENFHANKRFVPGRLVTSDHLEETVTYTANGRIIPVDENGNELVNAPHPQYQTDPQDATRVLAKETVPEIPGYISKFEHVTPLEPSQDTYVVYNKNLINELQELQNRGFVFVNNGLNADTVARSIDSHDDGSQTYAIGLRHGHRSVTPSHPGRPGQPINPDYPQGPKWPAGTGRDELVRTGQQIVSYTGAGENTPKNNVQKVEFARTMIIDRVTGKIIKDNGWNALNRQFGTVSTPVIDGYHADHKLMGGKTVTPESLTVEEVVTYTANGAIVPVKPNGQPIPGAEHVRYRTDPHDPTKVLNNEPVPVVPGYIPTQTTVTPSSPSQSTPIVYKPENSASLQTELKTAATSSPREDAVTARNLEQAQKLSTPAASAEASAEHVEKADSKLEKAPISTPVKTAPEKSAVENKEANNSEKSAGDDAVQKSASAANTAPKEKDKKQEPVKNTEKAKTAPTAQKQEVTKSQPKKAEKKVNNHRYGNTNKPIVFIPKLHDDK